MNDELKKLLDDAEDEELWNYYGTVEVELRKRGRLSGNVTGDRGEALALKFYNSTPNEPKLQLAPPGTKYIDAISREGKRYAIKSVKTSTTSTGTFQADDFKEQRFDFLIVVRMDEIYNHIRGLSPFPAAWTIINGKILKVFRAEKESAGHNLQYGAIDTDSKTYYKFAVKGGFIRLLEVQIEGKKRMDTETFLRGYR